MAAWRSPTCSLPDDDRKLAAFARMDLRTWHQNKATVMEFWTLEGGQYLQKRLTQERKYAEDLREKKRLAGLASAGKRASIRSTGVEQESNRGGNTMSTHGPTNGQLLFPSPSPSPSEEKNKSADAPHSQIGSRHSQARNYEEIRDFVLQQLQLPESDAEWLWEKWQGNGWRNNGHAMSKWRETASQWERQKNIFPSQKNSGKYS
jgi:hypothetical protein